MTEIIISVLTSTTSMGTKSKTEWYAVITFDDLSGATGATRGTRVIISALSYQYHWHGSWGAGSPFWTWWDNMTIALKDHATISIEARYNDMTFEHLSGAGGATRGAGGMIAALSYHPRNFGYKLEFYHAIISMEATYNDMIFEHEIGAGGATRGTGVRLVEWIMH